MAAAPAAPSRQAEGHLAGALPRAARTRPGPLAAAVGLLVIVGLAGGLLSGPDVAGVPGAGNADAAAVAGQGAETSPRLLRVRAAGGVETAWLAGPLTDAGWRDVAFAPLALRVATTRIGYYHAEDRGAAEGLARLVVPDSDESEAAVRDYGTLLPRPPRGTIDLWIAG